MKTYQIVRNLANSKSITIAELERKLNFSNGQISRWKKSNPNSEHLRAIADYFDVSVDYLLDREKQEYKGETNINDLLNKNNSFFREITQEYELSEQELGDIESDLKEYLEARSALLKKRRKGKS
ncbi:helix-turn-helix domain-containing protein [Mammaliicoccus sciuri]|uniref:helix-turn-helix domain-containing protein n=1 Tax=Mammaliicoccus sciuri TaxID=1296 RepID=UPI0037C61DD3